MTTTSQTRCDDTTGGNTLNTSEKPAKAKRFSLMDLHRLIFQLEGLEQTFDVETCSASQFDAFAEAMAEDFENVDRTVWPLEVRRDFVNNLWNFCLTEGYDFPLTEVADKAAQEGA
jgi:hypothetical protein